jgi:hypothetical protein
MKLDKMVPVNLDDFLSPDVSELRNLTTHGQFCWACQPLICQFVLDRFGVDMVTYLEADSLFFSNPEVLFDELGEKSVTLSPHNYTPEFDRSATSGIFCTQFNAFKNNGAGRAVLDYWKACCFTYSKEKPQLYPGQFSLNDWPERFDCVRILRHPGAGVAPWNIQRFKFEMINGVPTVDGLPIVFYHFHAYGRYGNGAHELGQYPLKKGVVDAIYGAYVMELKRAEGMVRKMNPTFGYRREYKMVKSFKEIFRSLSVPDFMEWVIVLKRKIRGVYNVFSDDYFTKNADPRLENH